MSDKVLLIIISIFVLIFSAGIIYLFTIADDSADTHTNETDIQQKDEQADNQDISKSLDDGSNINEDDYTTETEPETVAIKPEVICGALTGVVLNQRRKPVEKARLTVYTSTPNFPMKKYTPIDQDVYTDEKGIYTVSALPVNTKYCIVVSAKKFASAEVDDIVVDENTTTQVAEIRLSDGFSIFGKATDAETGIPLDAVEVVVKNTIKEKTGMLQVDHTSKAKTNKQGSYKVTMLSQGQYDITFKVPGYQSMTFTESLISLIGRLDEAKEVNAPLKPSGLTIRGVITSLSGQAVKDAEVEGIFSDMKNRSSFMTSTKTDENGAFTLTELSEGEYMIKVMAKTHFQKGIMNTRAGNQEVKVTMYPTGVANVTIKTGGAALHKYIISVENYTPSFRQVGMSPHPSLRGGPKPTFKLANLLPGTYQFLVIADGFAQTISDKIEIKSGETTNGIVINILTGGSIIGRLVDKKGIPIDGVAIQLKDKDFNPSIPLDEIFNMPAEQSKKSKSNKDGKFQITHIRPGNYSLKIKTAKMACKVVKNIVVKEGAVLDLASIKVANGGRIKGIAYDEEGRPAKGAKVIAASMEAGDRKTVLTNNKGHFDIPHLSPGQYILTLTPTTLMHAFKYDSSVTVLVDDEKTVVTDIVTRLAEKRK